MLTEAVRAHLQAAVAARRNLLIAGGTGIHLVVHLARVDGRRVVTEVVSVEGREGVLDPIGSGVLFRLGGVNFLFTAAHVLDRRRDDPLLMCTTAGNWVVAGEIATSVCPGDWESRFRVHQVMQPYLETVVL